LGNIYALIGIDGINCVLEPNFGNKPFKFSHNDILARIASYGGAGSPTLFVPRPFPEAVKVIANGQTLKPAFATLFANSKGASIRIQKCLSCAIGDKAFDLGKPASPPERPDEPPKIPPKNEKIVCRDDEKCPFRTHCKPGSSQQKDHFSKYKHRCLYGGACTIATPEHKEEWTHIILPACPNNACTQLSNVKHRSEFSHPGHWDFLLPCRNSPCAAHKQGKCDIKRYYHT